MEPNELMYFTVRVDRDHAPDEKLTTTQIRVRQINDNLYECSYTDWGYHAMYGVIGFTVTHHPKSQTVSFSENGSAPNEMLMSIWEQIQSHLVVE